MKKTLLLFAMLLGVVGAWAAVTQPETGVYVISGDENGRRGNLAACTGIPNFPALSNINWPGTTYGNNSVAAITNGEHWYVLKVYNRYVIYNLGLNKYLVKDGNNINFGDTPYLWQILVNGNYNSIYDEVGTYISFACGTQPSASTRNVKFNNSSTDGGSLHTFTVVNGGEQTYANQIGEVTKNAPIELSYELTDELGNVYTGMYAGFAGTDLPTLTGITFTSPRWENNKLYANITFPFPVSDAETTKKMMINGYTYSHQDFKWYAKDNTQIKVNEGSVPTVDNVNNYLWAIYPSVNEDVFTYTIKNIAANKYITSSATTGAHGNNTLAFNETGISFTLVKDSWGYAFKIADKKLYLSINTSTDGKGEQPLGLHGNTHDGTSLSFIPYVVNYTLTDEAGNTFTGEYEGWSEWQPELPTFTGAEYTLTNEAWNGNQFTADIEFNNLPFPVSSKTKINPTMISSFGGNINKWYATEAGILENGVAKKVSVIGTKLNQEPTDANRMTYMWAIYPTLKNNAFTYKVKNLATGTYVHSTSSTNSHAPGAVTLQSEGSELTYVIDSSRKQFKLSTGKYLSLNSSTATFVQYVGTWDTHGGCGLSLTKVEDVDFELHSFAVKSVVEGYESSNPNTHLGAISVNGNPWNLSTSTISNVEKKDLYVDLTKNISLAHTRNYRGYKFLGFWLGETEELGQTPTLTAEQVNAINETNPIIAKYEVIPGEVTLFYDDDAFSYRIPAIAKTSTGRLIAVSDYRYSLDDIGRYNFGDANPGIDLVMRYSDDNGKTWSETKTIAKCSGKRGTNDCAYGDAAIAVVGQKVLVMGAAGDVMFGDGSATAHNRTVRIFSEDNGATWTAPQDISETLFIGDDATIQNGYTAFFGSGKLAVDENYNNTGVARIYGAMLIKKESCKNAIYVIYTDDFGVTWSILGGSQTHVTANDEPKVEILPSGQILLSVRRGGGRQFNVFTYTDKATNAGSWNSNVNGCDNGGKNTCNGEIYVVDAKKANGDAVKLLLQSQPKGGSGLYDRRDVTIWYKEITDAAYTSSEIAGNWIQGMQVSTQQSAYSAMALQNDGKIAFFFEEAPCYGDDQAKGYCMVYMPLTVEEITKGNYADKAAQAKTVTVTVTDELDNTYNESLNIFVSDVETIKNLVKSTWAFASFGEEPTVITDGTSITYTNTVTLPFKVSNSENTYWHNIYFPANTQEQFYPVYLSASGASDEFVTKVTETQHYGASSYNTKEYASKINWAIYSVNNGLTFKFKNELTGKFIQATSVASDNAQNVKYVEEANATAFEIIPDVATYKGDYALKASINNSVGYLCSTSVSYANATHYSGNGHQGAWVKFVEAPNFDFYIGGINTELKAIGTDVGLYATDDDVEAARTVMASANTVKLNTLKEYSENIRRDGRTVNTPATGKFYRIKNNNTGSYIHGNTNGTVSVGSKDNYPTIFYLNENNELISYRAGRSLDCKGMNLAAVGTTYNCEFNVAYGGVTANVITIKNNDAWIGNMTLQSVLTNNTSGASSLGYNWTFENVDWLPVPVNTSVGYATLYSPVALNTLAPNKKNHRVEAYIGTIKGDRFSMKQVDAKDGIIPANTPVILVYKQDAENGLVYLEVVNSDKVASAENELRGTFESSYIEDDAYVLSAPEGKLGLYMADKNFYENNGTWTKDTTIGTHFLNNGFKAYLPAPAGADARFFLFDFSGEETGIDELKGENGNVKTEVYDLAGRRVQNAKKGIFVINGKVVVK